MKYKWSVNTNKSEDKCLNLTQEGIIQFIRQSRPLPPRNNLKK